MHCPRPGVFMMGHDVVAASLWLGIQTEWRPRYGVFAMVQAWDAPLAVIEAGCQRAALFWHNPLEAD